MTTTMTVTLTLNGHVVDAGDSAPTRTLLQFIRDRGLVGTKEGCGDGDCGACTVAIAGEAVDGTQAYVAVNSCLVAIGAVAGADIVTVEGVAQGADLHPAQQAMVDTAGSQCGYCTPGFVMSMFAAYEDPTRDADTGLHDDCVEGNLCRCTGYAPIRRAAQLMCGSRSRLPAVTPTRPVTASVFSRERALYRPTTIADALDLLVAHPDALLLAGGTDLGIEFSHHRLDPAVTVALDGIADLHTLDVTDDHVRIGAALPLSHLEHRAAGLFPALDEMIRWFAARQIRNRATIGGNLATASPIGDLPPVLLALGATVTIASPTGAREVPVDGFFTGYRATGLGPGEVISAVTIPRPDPATPHISWSYKVGKRGTDDISIVAAAFDLTLDRAPQADAVVTAARLAYGGIAATPVRAHAVEAALIGRSLNATTVAEAAAALTEAFTPLDDLRGSAAYRRRLTGSLFEKFAHQFAGVGA